MADASKFEMFGQILNLKDTTARNNADSAQSKADLAYSLADSANNLANSANNLANTANNTANKALEKTSNGVSFKKTIILGDSFAGSWYDGYQSWAQLFKNFVENVGGECSVYSYGGTGFVATGLENVTFADAWTDKVVPSEPEISETTCVIVQGGLNDYNQTTDVEKAGVKRLLQKIKESCPNSRIYGAVLYSLFQPFSTTMFGIYSGFRESGISATTSAPFQMLNRPELFSDDKLHPNKDGMELIFNSILSFIMGNGEWIEPIGGFVGGLGGGIIWRLTRDGSITIVAFGSSNSTDDTQSIGNVGYLAPNNYLAFSAYSDSGANTFFTIDTNGDAKIFKNDSGSHQLGTWRFSGTIPVTLK